jgi:hypothetical protein
MGLPWIGVVAGGIYLVYRVGLLFVRIRQQSGGSLKKMLFFLGLPLLVVLLGHLIIKYSKLP